MVDKYLQMARDEENYSNVKARAEKFMRSYADKSSIMIKDKDRVNTVEITHKVSEGKRTRTQMEYAYDGLMYGKVVDEKSRKAMKRFPELTFKSETYFDVDLYIKKDLAGKLIVYCTLPESYYHIKKWWLGKQVESNNFRTLVENFKSYMRKYGKASNVSIDKSPTHGLKGQVDSVRTWVSY